MTAFNQGVAAGKDDMPNYFKYSSPISGVEADKSSGVALAGLGQGIEGAAGLIESTAKDIIDKDVRSTVEPIREDFTKTLEAARAAELGNIVPAPVQGQAGSTGPSLVQPAAAPAPAAIDAGLSKVQSIQAAMENGKVNDTYYDQRLKAAVVDLRTKHPNFINYIDQKVSSITGINPANAYVQNLMQDINRAQTSKKTEFDKSLDLARGTVGDGILPNAAIQFNALQSQGAAYLPKWQQWYADESSKLGEIKRRDIYRKAASGNNDDIVAQRTKDWELYVGSTVHSNLSTMVKVAGVDEAHTLSDWITDMNTNPQKYNEEQAKELGTRVLGQKAVLESQLQAEMVKISKDNNGKPYSYASDITSAKAQETIKNSIAAYQTIADAITNDKAGLGFAVANHTVAILDQAQKDFLTNEKVGDFAKKVTIMNKDLGPNWTTLAVQMGLKDNIDQGLRGYLETKKADARLATSTLKKDFEAGDSLSAEGKITAGMKSRYYGNLVNLVDDIKNPDATAPAKQNILKYIFSPEGQGILSHIKTDYKDPTTGRDVPGKYSVWTRLSSDDIVKEVAKMPQEYRDMYKNYMEREAGKELFQKEFLNLNRYTGHDDLHFKYNDGEGGGVPQISLIDAKGKPVALPPDVPGQWGLGNTNTPTYLRAVDANVQRINTALAGMARVEKGLGGNPNEYMLQFLQRSQVDLGKNWEGLSAKVMEAIAASRAPSRRIEDTFKDVK